MEFPTGLLLLGVFCAYELPSLLGMKVNV